MMKAMQVQEANGPFVMVELPIPEPGPGQILIKVNACGVCHSDAMTKSGGFPGIELPRTPGHEVAGTIEKLGDGVTNLKVGQRVGVGWHGGHCFKCDNCRHGDFINCVEMKVCGIAYDGGYAEYMIAPWEAAARIPDELSAVEAAPLLCAGITMFNSLRNSGCRPGDTVAVQGIGGLGHLGIQFAKKMGFRVVALSRGPEKKELAKELGAHLYIDGKADDTVAELKKLGGADLILCTAPSGKAIASVVDGLSSRGKVLIVAAAFDPIEVSAITMLSGKAIGLVEWHIH